MANVGIYDLLSFTPTDTSQIVLQHVDICGDVNPVVGMPTDDRNLIYRALDLVRNQAGQELGVQVEICKRIPTEAGLGGASSNAAAAILAANQIWNLNWSISRLRELATRLGSDVAYFLTGGLALCFGRGEKVVNLNYACNWDIVIAKPPEGFSTADIYSRCEVPTIPIKSDELLVGLKSGNVSRVGRHLFNRLQQFATGVSQWVERLGTEFDRTASVVGHQLTGSGSCYFGIYPNRKSARLAATCLSSRLPNVSFYSCQMNCAEFSPSFAEEKEITHANHRSTHQVDGTIRRPSARILQHNI